MGASACVPYVRLLVTQLPQSARRYIEGCLGINLLFWGLPFHARPSDIERINLDEAVCTTFSDEIILKMV